MSLEQWMAIFAGCTAAAAMAQVGVAIFLYRVARRQKDISEDQKKLAQKIDESNAAMYMQSEYFDLSGSRASLWDYLDAVYSDFRESREKATGQVMPESLHLLIDESGFPPFFDPVKEANLREFILANTNTWDSMPIWDFALDLISGRRVGTPQFNKNCKDLSDFWHVWSQRFDNICDYVDPNPRELILLTWVEFAKAHNTPVVIRQGAGKKGLFTLAKRVTAKNSSN